MQFENSTHGTLVMIKRMERGDNAMHIIVQGTERIKVLEWRQEESYLRVLVQILPEVKVVDADEVEATKRNVQAMIQQALHFCREFRLKCVWQFSVQLIRFVWRTFSALFLTWG